MKTVTTKAVTTKGVRCLFSSPPCSKPAKTRGLCANHYQTAGDLVRAGQVTWEELETAGKTNPPRSGGVGRTPTRDWFLAAKGKPAAD